MTCINTDFFKKCWAFNFLLFFKHRKEDQVCFLITVWQGDNTWTNTCKQWFILSSRHTNPRKAHTCACAYTHIFEQVKTQLFHGLQPIFVLKIHTANRSVFVSVIWAFRQKNVLIFFPWRRQRHIYFSMPVMPIVSFHLRNK